MPLNKSDYVFLSMPLLNFHLNFISKRFLWGNNQDRAALKLLEPSKEETEYSKARGQKNKNQTQIGLQATTLMEGEYPKSKFASTAKIDVMHRIYLLNLV